ncbi:MAG TPA: hypothetical protein VGD37_17235, partial [Kofleriaceae bacterium]
MPGRSALPCPAAAPPALLAVPAVPRASRGSAPVVFRAPALMLVCGPSAGLAPVFAPVWSPGIAPVWSPGIAPAFAPSGPDRSPAFAALAARGSPGRLAGSVETPGGFVGAALRGGAARLG